MDSKKVYTTRTRNPFNKGGWSHDAWQTGYNSLATDTNPYGENTALFEFWEAGRVAKRREKL